MVKAGNSDPESINASGAQGIEFWPSNGFYEFKHLEWQVEKQGCDGLVMSREWMKYAFRNKRCTGKLRDSGGDLEGQG